MFSFAVSKIKRTKINKRKKKELDEKRVTDQHATTQRHLSLHGLRSVSLNF
jgi:hypothetical protein